jgi:hypothetical protein
MNEHGFTKAVLKLLPRDVHVQSMTTASLTHGGTPDRYIDYKSDLWVEFKYADTSGMRNGIAIGRMITPLQHRWLERRFLAGGNVMVILGLPSDRARGIFLETPEAWQGHVDPEMIAQRITDAPRLAARILERVS